MLVVAVVDVVDVIDDDDDGGGGFGGHKVATKLAVSRSLGAKALLKQLNAVSVPANELITPRATGHCNWSSRCTNGVLTTEARNRMVALPPKVKDFTYPCDSIGLI